MSRFVRVASLEDVPVGEGRCVRVGPAVIALFRIGDADVRAVDALCPHGGGPLADGIVAGENVICPLHGWRVSLGDGRVESPGGCEQSIRRFPVEVREREIHVDVRGISGEAPNPRSVGWVLERLREQIRSGGSLRDLVHGMGFPPEQARCLEELAGPELAGLLSRAALEEEELLA